jgi:nicotinamide riboside kinase
MIIGFCGSSSTGKSTLLKALMAYQPFRERVGEYRQVDARSILRSLGHQSMDQMNEDNLQQFQKIYLSRKIQNETGISSFCSDRTFVDIAAYWRCRDAPKIAGSASDKVTPICRKLARNYTLHVFLPFGLFPFESDGYRSVDLSLHEKISRNIKQLLLDWNLSFIELDSQDLLTRTHKVLDALCLPRI